MASISTCCTEIYTVSLFFTGKRQIVYDVKQEAIIKEILTKSFECQILTSCWLENRSERFVAQQTTVLTRKTVSVVCPNA